MNKIGSPRESKSSLSGKRNKKYAAKKHQIRKLMDAMNTTGSHAQFQPNLGSLPMEEKVNDDYQNIAVALKRNCGDNWLEYLRNFKNEEVFDDDLKNLSHQDLACLIPRMGPRKRFAKWMRMYTEYNSNAATLGNIRLHPSSSKYVGTYDRPQYDSDDAA